MARCLPIVHPGEVLREEFMRPLGLSSNALAGAISAPTPKAGSTCRITTSSNAPRVRSGSSCAPSGRARP